MLGEFSVAPDNEYFDDINPSISEEDNAMLSESPSDEEIRDAVHNLPKDSAPGPDGFNDAFCQACWTIAGDDVSKAIKHFFEGLVCLAPSPRRYSR